MVLWFTFLPKELGKLTKAGKLAEAMLSYRPFQHTPGAAIFQKVLLAKTSSSHHWSILVLTTGYQGPPSHMESSQFSQSLRPDKEEREHVWIHATACLCFSHGIQIYHGHTYAHHCPTQAFLNVLRVLLKILVFLSSLTDLLIKMINMIVL